MMTNDMEYIKAYTEVNCLLAYLPQSYIEKLPKKLIDLIKNQSNEKFNIDIDTNKSLLEQNFSAKTKDLIAVIKYNYWSSDEQKKQLKSMFCDNENKYQKELLEKYDPNNIFEKKENCIEDIESTNINVQLIPYKENIFKRFINKIKKFLL